MRNSTGYFFDPFSIFLVLVLLNMGTRFWGADTAGYTVQPAKDPEPQLPAEDLINQEHKHHEIEPVKEEEQDTSPDKPDSAGAEPQETTDAEDIAAPVNLINTEKTKEPPPVTLPAGKSTPDLWRWPE